MDAAQALKSVYLFQEVPEAALSLLAQAAQQVSFGGGETVASTQSQGCLYLVLNGSVRAFREGTKVSVVFGTGESFGAAAFVDGGPLGMNAVALERAEVLVLRPDRVAELLARNPDAGHHLYRAIARSLAARLRRVVAALPPGED